MQVRWKKYSHRVFQGNNPDYFLTPVELPGFIDFTPVRIYWLHGMKHDECFTGSHCHLLEEELMTVVAGSMIIELDDGNGEGLREIEMKANDSIYIGPKVWHHLKEMKQGTVIVILASTPYSADRSDYLEDYKEFQRILAVESVPISK